MGSLKHSSRSQSGFSIVEVLVGLAVGLFVIGGALKLFVDNLGSSRRQVLEMRVNQDLRAVADLIARDLRRAAYWGNSTAGVVTTSAMPVAATSPYRTVEVSQPSGAAPMTIAYSYEAVSTAESYGFQHRDDGVIYFQQSDLSSSSTPAIPWVPITDINTLRVTAFTITPTVTQVPLAQYCTGGTCAGATCPRLNLRSYTIHLTGQSATDSNVKRSLQLAVRLRNNELTGVCPPT